MRIVMTRGKKIVIDTIDKCIDDFFWCEFKKTHHGLDHLAPDSKTPYSTIQSPQTVRGKGAVPLREG